MWYSSAKGNSNCNLFVILAHKKGKRFGCARDSKDVIILKPGQYDRPRQRRIKTASLIHKSSYSSWSTTIFKQARRMRGTHAGSSCRLPFPVRGIQQPLFSIDPRFLGIMPQVPSNVVVHPLVLLSVVDHYKRVAGGTKKRVVGILLGSSAKGLVDCTNSYAGMSLLPSTIPICLFLALTFTDFCSSLRRRW